MNASNRPVTQFSLPERLQHNWVRHRWTDWLLALIVVGGWLVFGRIGWLPVALTEVPEAARRTAYQILATVAATMGGFTLTSISILVNLLRTPMTAVDRLLPAGDKQRVGAAFVAALPTLFALFVAALVGLTTDANTEAGYWWVQAVIIAAAFAAVASIARVVWILRRLLALSSDS
ncbi:hypothetical protein H7J87_04615 [Mycolicibacterium wolinskyi]|uniref:Transmembrane protein n=1 Tax=Mycolicibacterium wolinskyi TaxID=59750 RepID=A0A1X2FEE2_9MYCO|nr:MULTISPECIES: hypothetical protein [Mycolicibacterium]MCV7284604.1 hypothetical protein [Mycolicibacterium wolinskyi]MCV7291989.1 hypothetical protein [Mycolicibacterium goodii]ORX16678.1 hypothetical protein AWC31_21945 [Mycolicibacterium wolinskyi]